jgi:molybdopterin-guanine dinucleotide biosynthesis protein A
LIIVSSSGTAGAGAAARVSGTTLRTSLPLFASARTTVFMRGAETSGDAAKAGIITMSIKQVRTEMFSKPSIVVNIDGTILDSLELSSRRAAWILAGGQSSRMGADKALIEIDGISLVLRVASEALKICGSAAVVGDPARYGSLGLPVFPDRFSGKGPLAGIESALSATKVEWNLVVACDMPALDSALLESLFNEAEGPSDFGRVDSPDCVLPSYEDGRVEPLCAVYNRRCQAAIEAALRAGVRKITDALAPLALRYIRVTRPDSFANLNTPEELRQFQMRRRPNG